MAIASNYITTTTNTGTGAISGGVITTNNTSGLYDPYRDTIHGVPLYDWQRMSASEQRYYAEREYMRQQHMKMAMPPDLEEKKIAVKTAPEPTFLNNKTLLLLEY